MALAQENTTRGSVSEDKTFEILVGTYEEFILGYRLTTNSEGGWSLSQNFTNHSHCGSIRSVATSSRYVATGSSDESVRLFDLKQRTEHGYLQQHNGTVTCLEFYKNTHLFTGSEDGNICVWKTHDWQCEKTLNAHKGGVVALAIHPSGKLALSVGKDRTLKTWNLIKGRTAYVTNIKAVAELVKWSPSADHYAVAINNEVHIYSVAVAGVVHVIDFQQRVFAVAFLTDDIIAIGGEASQVEIHNIKAQVKLSSFEAHEKRVRDLAACHPHQTGQTETDKERHVWFVSASNDGFIKLWNIALADTTVEPELITSVDTACRITSLAIWKGVLAVKREENLDGCTEEDTQVEKTNIPPPLTGKKVLLAEKKPKPARVRPEAHITVEHSLPVRTSKPGPQSKPVPKNANKATLESKKQKQNIRTASGTFSVQEFPQAFKRSLDIVSPVKIKKKRSV